MTEQWLLKKRNFNSPNLKKYITEELLIDAISRRNIDSEEALYQYLNKSRRYEHNPFLLKNMDSGVELLADYVKNKKKILLALDYDVDGIVSGAISYIGLQQIGANCDYIFPNRITDGYGLNTRMVEYAHEHNFDMIVTFDNGISAFEAIHLAKQYHIKTIITDHHEIPQIEIDGKNQDHLVEADCIINPKQRQCTYPYKNICGAMIAYKLILALYHHLQIKEEKLQELYSLVAIATICDVMDLVDENRIFVDKGLQLLRKSNLPGIQVLLSSLNLGPSKQLSASDVAFQMGPVLNSAGRLKSADLSLKLLIAQNYKIAQEYANMLIQLNQERKLQTKNSFKMAQDLIVSQEQEHSNIIIIYLNDCHESIAGIVAGRIKEEYNVSTIVFTDSNNKDEMKGSARATDDVNIFQELIKFKGHLIKFGGHTAAAGLSLSKESFPLFYKELKQHFEQLDIDKKKTFYVDVIADLQTINLSLAKNLSIFEPTGKGNPPLIFSSLGLKLKKITLLGEQKNVLKLEFFTGKINSEFVSFSPQKILKKIKMKMEFVQEHDIIGVDLSTFEDLDFDVLYKVGINYFNHREYLNLEIISIR